MLREMIGATAQGLGDPMVGVQRNAQQSTRTSSLRTWLPKHASSTAPSHHLAIIGPRANGTRWCRTIPVRCARRDRTERVHRLVRYDSGTGGQHSLDVPAKAVLMSEFGAEAKFGNHGPSTSAGQKSNRPTSWTPVHDAQKHSAAPRTIRGS